MFDCLARFASAHDGHLVCTRRVSKRQYRVAYKDKQNRAPLASGHTCSSEGHVGVHASLPRAAKGRRKSLGGRRSMRMMMMIIIIIRRRRTRGAESAGESGSGVVLLLHDRSEPLHRP